MGTIAPPHPDNSQNLTDECDKLRRFYISLTKFSKNEGKNRLK
jgi:hypothetical protein